MPSPGAGHAARSLSTRPTRASRAWRPAVFLAPLFLGCLAGLFSSPLDLFDAPLLVLGGRIVRAGKLPYLDFYTHYGPLGYDLISWFLPVGNPGVAYRLAQTFALLLLAVLTLVVWKVHARPSQTWAAAAVVAVCYLNLTTTLAAPHFLASLLVFGAVGFLLLAEADPTAAPARGLWIASGACLALAALVRPAFGAYGGAAIIAFAAADPTQKSGRRLLEILAAACGVGALVWLVFYRQIPVAEAYFATVSLPARLAASSSRFVLPQLAAYPAAVPALWVGAVQLAATFALATLGGTVSGNRAARAMGLAGVCAAALLVVELGSSRNPGRDASYGSALLFALAFGTWRLARERIAADSALRSAALTGLTAIAFFHYYLARADPSHLSAALGLAVAAGAWTLPALSWKGRAAACALAVIALRSPTLGANASLLSEIGRGPLTPSVSTARGFWARTAASEFPVEAVAAVAAADRGAAPDSRFVALASDHSSTEGSAAVLFLLSSRLPYTKWYAYDPGVQTSALIQRRMIDELRASGSRTAVIWNARSFGGRDPESDAPPSSPLDRSVRELYPAVVERFGGLTLRAQESSPAPPLTAP